MTSRRTRPVGAMHALGAVALLVVSSLVVPVVVGPDATTTRPTGSPSPGAVPPALRDVRSVVAVGDSVPEGETCGCTPFVTLVAQRLATRLGRPVTAVNDGIGGLTAADLLARLTTGGPPAEPDVRADVRSAGLVVATVGANDLADLDTDDAATACPVSCYGPQAQASADRVGQIVDAIHGLNPSATIAVTNYWNVFVDGAAETDPAKLAWNDAVTRAFDDDLARRLRRSPAVLVDTFAAFKGAGGDADPTFLLLADGDHPDAAGHALIARTVLTSLGVR